MDPKSPADRPSPILFRLAATGALIALLGSACSVAPSRTARGAGIGAATGAVGGSVLGPSVGVSSGTAVLGGAAAGALIGGIAGLIQEAKENKEQENMAITRAVQQEATKRRQAQAAQQAILDEELKISKGYKITELELEEQRRRTEMSDARLKALIDERNAMKAKSDELTQLEAKDLDNQAKIAELVEELGRLKGQPIPTDRMPMPTPGTEVTPAAPGSSPTSSSAPSAGSSGNAPVRAGLD